MSLIYSHGPPQRGFHILVLDDDANEGTLLGDALNHLRPEALVQVVSSPEEAIRFLYKDAEFVGYATPQLIFLDYRMPSNGGRVLSILKGDPDLRPIPVIAMCVDASLQDIHEIYSRNANCCVNKPKEMNDLTKEMRCALAFWMDVALLQHSPT